VYTRDGAASAAMEFDETNLKPTFRVLMDAAGVSAGLEIAGRLGLGREIVEKARGLLGEDTRQTEAFLCRLRDLTGEMEERRDAIMESQEALARERSDLQAETRKQVERLRTRSNHAIEVALKEFRAEAGREIREIQNRKQQEKAQRRQSKAERNLQSAAERRRAGLIPELAGGDPALRGRTLSVDQLRPGMEVLVRSLSRRGKIVKLRGSRVDVRLGTVSFTVQASDLATPDGKEDAPPRKLSRGSSLVQEAERRRHEAARRPETDQVMRDVPVGPVQELLLLGKTVEEALETVDRFLDRAVMSGTREVRVVHGHGTGRLKAAIRKFLSADTRVSRHRPGRDGEGGDGATVVKLN